MVEDAAAERSAASRAEPQPVQPPRGQGAEVVEAEPARGVHRSTQIERRLRPSLDVLRLSARSHPSPNERVQVSSLTNRFSRLF